MKCYLVNRLAGMASKTLKCCLVNLLAGKAGNTDMSSGKSFSW